MWVAKALHQKVIFYFYFKTDWYFSMRFPVSLSLFDLLSSTLNLPVWLFEVKGWHLVLSEGVPCLMTQSQYSIRLMITNPLWGLCMAGFDLQEHLKWRRNYYAPIAFTDLRDLTFLPSDATGMELKGIHNNCIKKRSGALSKINQYGKQPIQILLSTSFCTVRYFFLFVLLFLWFKQLQRKEKTCCQGRFFFFNVYRHDVLTWHINNR